MHTYFQLSKILAPKYLKFTVWYGLVDNKGMDNMTFQMSVKQDTSNTSKI